METELLPVRLSLLRRSHLQAKHKTLTLLFQPNVKYCKKQTQPPFSLLRMSTQHKAQVKTFSCEYLCLILSLHVFRGLVHLWLLLIP